jgi:iron complex transport system ATP-binding protein
VTEAFPPGTDHGERAAGPVLEFAGVGLTRGETTILSGIDWRVEAGEHWVVLGANGSGKTMLLSIAAGFLWPSSGSVSVLGHELGSFDLRELHATVGWVSSAFRERIPRREAALAVVRGGLTAMVGQPLAEDAEADGKAVGCLRLLACEHVAERPFGVLSQGEQQRVLIARALVAEPRLVVLDEVCSGLDPAARERLVRSLERLTADPDAPTLLFVTHHVEEIARGFTHALVLSEGRVLASGELREALTGEVLSRAFEIGVRVTEHDGRFVADAEG